MQGTIPSDWKKQRKEFFQLFHRTLSNKFDLPEDVIVSIRFHVFFGKKRKDELMDYYTNQLKRKDIGTVRVRRYTKALIFLGYGKHKDFLEVTQQTHFDRSFT